jgi:hypothetical protein
VCVYIKGAFVGVMNEQFDSIIDIWLSVLYFGRKMSFYNTFYHSEFEILPQLFCSMFCYVKCRRGFCGSIRIEVTYRKCRPVSMRNHSKTQDIFKRLLQLMIISKYVYYTAN